VGLAGLWTSCDLNKLKTRVTELEQRVNQTGLEQAENNVNGYVVRVLAHRVGRVEQHIDALDQRVINGTEFCRNHAPPDDGYSCWPVGSRFGRPYVPDGGTAL
jgi:hypothetical protein